MVKLKNFSYQIISEYMLHEIDILEKIHYKLIHWLLIIIIESRLKRKYFIEMDKERFQSGISIKSRERIKKIIFQQVFCIGLKKPKENFVLIKYIF